MTRWCVSRSTLASCAGAGALVFGAGLASLPTGAAAQAAPPGQAGEVQEVIVTATRRAEALQDVPLAVTALSGEQVERERVQNFADIPALVPGATFISTKGQSTANVQIRGQVVTNDSPHLELPVAVFIDDIYHGTLASFSADFFDIEQLAILRGPQGTTFGRNVVGGALQITSRKPRLGVNDGQISVGVSQYDTADDPGFESRGYINAALSDTMAGRLAYSFKHIGGYTPNRTTGSYLNDQKSFAIRPSLRFQPSERLDVLLLGYYFRESQLPTGYKSIGEGGIAAANAAATRTAWDVFHDVDGEYERDIYLAQVRADYDAGFGTLTSITSYRSLYSYYADDGDSTPLPMNDRSLNESDEWQFSQELRLTSPDEGPFTYVAGAYYSFENIHKLIGFGFNGTVPGSLLGRLHCLSPVARGFAGCPPVGAPFEADNYGPRFNQEAFGTAHVKSYAVFAEGKYQFSDALALTLGGRYSILDKSGYTAHVGYSLFYGNPFDVDFEESWDSFTPRAILQWTPSEDIMAYASYSTGFKGGGWSLTTNTAAKAVIPLEPEKSESFEIGAKTQLFDRRVTINVAAYQADTKDLQVRSLVNGVLNDTNAGVLRARGVELETAANLGRLSIGANYAYTDAFYKEFQGCAAGGVDCTGNKAPFVPEHDLTVFLQYVWDLANGGRLTAKADAKWTSDFPVGPLNNQPLVEELTGKNGLVNGSLIWESPDDTWSAQLWVRNLTNEWSFGAASNYFFYFLSQAEFAAGAREVDRGPINPPRQVGLTLTRNF